jgi:hypothetical protein
MAFEREARKESEENLYTLRATVLGFVFCLIAILVFSSYFEKKM